MQYERNKWHTRVCSFFRNVAFFLEGHHLNVSVKDTIKHSLVIILRCIRSILDQMWQKILLVQKGSSSFLLQINITDNNTHTHLAYLFSKSNLNSYTQYFTSSEHLLFLFLVYFDDLVSSSVLFQKMFSEVLQDLFPTATELNFVHTG